MNPLGNWVYAEPIGEGSTDFLVTGDLNPVTFREVEGVHQLSIRLPSMLFVIAVMTLVSMFALAVAYQAGGIWIAVVVLPFLTFVAGTTVVLFYLMFSVLRERVHRFDPATRHINLWHQQQPLAFEVVEGIEVRTNRPTFKGLKQGDLGWMGEVCLLVKQEGENWRYHVYSGSIFYAPKLGQKLADLLSCPVVTYRD